MKIGVIGCGAIAQRAHIPAFNSIEGIEIHAVCDVNEEKARKTAKKYRIERYYTDYKTMLKDPSINLVSICTPPNLHTEIIIEAAKTGKHILVEKPLATKLGDALKALQTVKENKIKLCVTHNYRYFPAIRKAKTLIDNGGIGRIVSITHQANIRIPLTWTTSTWFYHENGILEDFGPHLIDINCWLIKSRPRKVAAIGGDFLGNMKSINNIQILTEYENKTLTTINMNWLTPPTLKINIHGTAGFMEVDLQFNHLQTCHEPQNPMKETINSIRKLINTTWSAITGKQHIYTGAIAFYKPLIKDFIKSIEKGGQPPITGEEAIQTIAILEAARISLKQNKIINIKKLFEMETNTSLHLNHHQP